MKKLLLFLLALFALSACAIEQQEVSGIDVYFLAVEDGFERLVPQRVEVPEETDTDGLVALVAASLTQHEGMGVQTVPDGVALSVTRNGSMATVDFGSGLGELSAAKKSMVTAAVALSLLEIDGISYIYVKIDGQSYPPFYDRVVTRASFVTEEMAKPLLGQQ